MSDIISNHEVAVDKLRWRVDPAKLPFETTADLTPLKDIIGQKRGVEAIRFGMGMSKSGFNVFVTGTPGSGRLSTVRRILTEISSKDGNVPDDLCYVNNFKNNEAPVLVKMPAGSGGAFKKAVHDLVETLKKDVPQHFESQDYINRKKAIMEEYENKGKDFFKNLEKEVKEQGFAMVNVPVGQITRPDIMPLVDGNPTPIEQLEAMVEKGRFPKEEYEEMKEKQAKLRAEIEQIFLELRDMQKKIQENVEKMDQLIFTKLATELVDPITEKYNDEKIKGFFQGMLEDMTEHLQIFSPQPQQQIPGMPVMMPET
ncbi:MAG: AAA family ATPase, partial [Deltaproteobacteria bacterium]|nr:AAA family ATPase [Deltaproteobacteria bacterium]